MNLMNLFEPRRSTILALFVGILPLSLFFSACSNHQSSEERTQARGGMPMTTNATELDESPVMEKSGEEAKDKISASPEAMPAMPAKRAFMRTAELQYRTKNVANTTETIENWTRQYGGFVLLSSLSTSVDNSNTSPQGRDSLLENTIFTIHNTMTLRVPNAKFDTLLQKINTTMDFLEIRKISADDVSLTLLGNSIRAKSAQQSAARLRNAIARNGKKLTEMTEAERLALETETEATGAAMSNLSLQDRIDFCTVEVRMYQRPIVQQRTIQNLDKYINYTPPFFSRIGNAISDGFYIFVEIFLGLLSVWYLLPLGFVVYFLYKKWRNR